jgi:hypothetical protein
MYAEYRQVELRHSEQEQSLSADIDSLNRLVDSLTVNTKTPFPHEVVRRKAASIHLARHEAIRRAISRGEIKTQKEARDYDGGLRENFKRTEQSIKDPVLHEEFMQAYFSYFNLNDQLYDSLARVLQEE